MLEKLINEHGSAKIFKERLGLKEDQISAIKAEYSSLVQENSDLKRQNKLLNISLEQTRQEIDRLQKIIDAATKNDGAEKLDDIKENILKKLFDANQERSAEWLANILNVKVGVAKYHIDILLELKFIGEGPIIIEEPQTYYLTRLGRKHLIENKLI